MRLLFVVAVVTHACACGGAFNAGRSSNRARLQEAGLQVREMRGGWVQIAAPEGYTFIMPGVPRFDEEVFEYGSGRVRSRRFDAPSEQNSKGFYVHVFDARSLDTELRRRLRVEALQLFLPEGGRVRSSGTVDDRGLEIEIRNMDGFGASGQHVGTLFSFDEDGFIWFLLAVHLDGLGEALGEDARAFLARGQ